MNIDHTLLSPETTPQDIERLCAEARTHRFTSVCVHPCYVPLAAVCLQGSGVKTITVVGFPLGANLTETKAQEARHAIALGAEEIDMVLNIGALKSGNDEYVQADITAVVLACGHVPVKVILETAALTDDEIKRGCTAALNAGAAFVKTSTGFHPKGGASVEAVRLMKTVVGDRLGIKASGGIRTFDDAMKMIEAGATRLGTSQSVQIVTGGKTQASSGQY